MSIGQPISEIAIELLFNCPEIEFFWQVKKYRRTNDTMTIYLTFFFNQIFFLPNP